MRTFPWIKHWWYGLQKQTPSVLLDKQLCSIENPIFRINRREGCRLLVYSGCRAVVHRPYLLQRRASLDLVHQRVVTHRRVGHGTHCDPLSHSVRPVCSSQEPCFLRVPTSVSRRERWRKLGAECRDQSRLHTSVAALRPRTRGASHHHRTCRLVLQFRQRPHCLRNADSSSWLLNNDFPLCVDRFCRLSPVCILWHFPLQLRGYPQSSWALVVWQAPNCACISLLNLWCDAWRWDALHVYVVSVAATGSPLQEESWWWREMLQAAASTVAVRQNRRHTSRYWGCPAYRRRRFLLLHWTSA